MIRAEFHCADGSPFPVAFATVADANRRWRIDREHIPQARSPLADAATRVGWAGATRAYADSGLPFPRAWWETPEANGYAYYLEGFVSDPDELKTLFEGCARLVAEHGSLAVWRDHCLPGVAAACQRLAEAAPDTHFETLADDYNYALHRSMISAFIASNDMRLVADLCDEATAHHLSQGYDNETLKADAALWDLAHRPLGPEADAARAAYLADYGIRSAGWTLDDPTLTERPADLDAHLRLVAGAPDPRQAVAAAAARRDALADQVAASLADDDQRARFRRRVARLATVVPVREDRALWQLRATGLFRAAVLRRGAALVADGVLADPADVFFLTPAEYDDPPAAAATAELVVARRAETDHWRSVTPPLVIGPDAPHSAPPSDPVLTGVPASGGRARGRARVITDLADAERLEPGDVLVCVMTSPPWTALFGLAAAVVSDAGDRVSHVAIAAREYGIPCVVGTVWATTVIADGATLTVDGDAGTVTRAR